MSTTHDHEPLTPSGQPEQVQQDALFEAYPKEQATDQPIPAPDATQQSAVASKESFTEQPNDPIFTQQGESPTNPDGEDKGRVGILGTRGRKITAGVALMGALTGIGAAAAVAGNGSPHEKTVTEQALDPTTQPTNTGMQTNKPESSPSPTSIPSTSETQPQPTSPAEAAGVVEGRRGQLALPEIAKPLLIEASGENATFNEGVVRAWFKNFDQLSEPQPGVNLTKDDISGLTVLDPKLVAAQAKGIFSPDAWNDFERQNEENLAKPQLQQVPQLWDVLVKDGNSRIIQPGSVVNEVMSVEITDPTTNSASVIVKSTYTLRTEPATVLAKYTVQLEQDTFTSTDSQQGATEKVWMVHYLDSSAIQ